MMPVYSVIVCPKCRKSAQLIEQKGAKTTRCQRCGATLQTRKLRVFHTTDNLEEAIAVRTRLQAEVLGKGYETMKGSAASKGASFSTFTSSPGHGSGSVHAEKETAPNFQAPSPNIKPQSKKKDSAKIILSILEKEQGALQVTALQELALRQDLDEETFGVTMEKLLRKGDIYSPKKGYVRAVP
ncbi:DUF5817 domain-containing protein [Methanococcoides methylutens]|uniref:DUF5817 domain-containing protein n=1 Tax=Methanococcoides methylutens MM1 TaxID=1434104 RepID=A0A0E3SQG3_METMT|nr:DUF1922 domain-containing protein [Methanococcoides methylutens]AKB84232.1 hypothetical protein MCMEM_0179 [Methanococcoides methylutens MM1]